MGVARRVLPPTLKFVPTAIGDCLNAVFPAIPYCTALVAGAYLVSDPGQCKIFRPAHAQPE